MAVWPHELKGCEHCGKLMPRRRESGQGNKSGFRLESWKSYASRVYCDRKCFGAARRKKALEAQKNQVQNAKAAKAAAAEKEQTGVLAMIRERLGADWIEWAERVKAEIDFDPLGFYRLVHSGEFEVDFQTSSGEGKLGIQEFKPRKSQDEQYIRTLKHRRAATDPEYRKRLELEDPSWRGKRIGRQNELRVKSRRFGVTTGEIMQMLGDGTANRGWNAVITAYSDDGLQLLSEICRTALKRDKEAGAKGMAVKRFETRNDSVTRLLGPRDSLGRGGGFRTALVSEADYIPDLDAALDSMLPSVDKSPMARVIIESTMRKGATTGYKNFVKRSLRGETAYEVVFLGWMQDDTAVLEPTQKELAYFKSIKAMNAVNEIDKYILQLKTMGASMEQLAWWYQRLREDARGELDRMKEAYPTTIEEALENAEGEDYYTQKALDYLNQQVRAPLARYVMNCEAEPPMQRLNEGSNWANTPHMELWFKPETEAQYAIICDSGTGKAHGGANIATVFRTDPDHGGVLCALWLSRRSVHEFANAVKEIHQYYNNALIVVENNKDGGLIEALNIRLKLPLSKLYHMERFDRDRVEDQAAIGFTMTSWSRGMAMDRMQMCVNEMRLIIPSQLVFDQIKLTGDRRGIAPGGGEKMRKPDDAAICVAIACLVRNFSSRWPSRSPETMRSIFTKPQVFVDDELRESVNTWTADTYRKLAERQRLNDALRRSLGG